MKQTFDENEKMLRAVWPRDKKPNFWKKGDGNKISSAALKQKSGGLSVDRTSNRSIGESVEYAKRHLEGAIVSIAVPACREAGTHLVYLPSEQNPYHSEIHSSKEQEPLTDKQAKDLARSAQVEFMP